MLYGLFVVAVELRACLVRACCYPHTGTQSVHDTRDVRTKCGRAETGILRIGTTFYSLQCGGEKKRAVRRQ